jgi:hypothetical protein
MREERLIRFRQPLLFQPVERATPFSFAAVVDETRSVWFPKIESEIEARIVAHPALASAWQHRMGFERHIIVFHPVLNRRDVPIEVVRFIAKHELVHLEMFDEGHSDRFFERELEVGPERFAVWAWLHQNLYPPIRATRWGTRVLRNWRSASPVNVAPYTPHLPFDDLPWRVLCPEGGGQLRLPPGWVSTSQPLSSVLRASSLILLPSPSSLLPLT